MGDERAWEEMLAEFRALGGTAENICLGEGVYGRGLFPLDAARPVAIRIPDNLLIDIGDAQFENGAFRVAPDAKIGVREKTFLESYEDRFSWGGGRAEIERIFGYAQALPQEQRHELRTEHFCGTWFDDVSERAIEEKFLGSRCIGYKGRSVIMPIIELANHGIGAGYDTSDGVSLSGTFSGEVFVRYSNTDSYGLFLNWGFAAEQPQAMSIVLNGDIAQTRLRIERDLGDLKPAERVWVPKLSRDSDGCELSFLMTGNRQYPRLSKGIFYKIMREAGLSGFEEAFDAIQHINRMHFLDLLAALENTPGPMAQTLRRMARFQLQAMSFSVGVRAI
jgi:hypothetical protein